MCDTKVIVDGCLITIKHNGKERQLYDAPWMFSGYTQEEWDVHMVDEVNQVISMLRYPDIIDMGLV